MPGFHGSRNFLDFFHYVHAFYYFAKHGVSPAFHCFGGVVQKVIVFHVDEKLGGSGVWVHGARHGNRTGFVAQAIIGLVLDGITSALLLHAGLKATALNHEVADHPVKNDAVIKTFLHITFEVFGGFGGFFVVQL